MLQCFTFIVFRYEQKKIVQITNAEYFPAYPYICVKTLIKLFTFLTNKLTLLLDQVAPVRTVQTRTRYAPWLSKETKASMKTRDTAQKQAADTQHPDDWRLYKNLRNTVLYAPTFSIRVDPLISIYPLFNLNICHLIKINNYLG